jgi:uncharacterized phage protein gp47/JayE
MSCTCDCVGCTEFCDCSRCSKPETGLLAPPRNRAGLDAVKARIGDYGAFFTDAKHRLSSHESPNLQALGTRDQNDPTIALLDAWSVAADVLTFYRERLTQEAYLRTAIDEFSLRELANMVGFKPRPGIAATVHLAYLLDSSAKPVDIDPGAKVQSVPEGSGEKMQTFETDEKLTARAEWSQMKPRQSRPSNIDIFDALTRTTLRLDDPSLLVRPGERVLFVFGMKLAEQVVREVLSAKINIELRFVELTLKPKDGLVALINQADLLKDLIKQRDFIATNIAPSNSANDEDSQKIGKYLLTVLSSYFLGNDASESLSFLEPLKDTDQERDLPFKDQKRKFVDIFKVVANSLPSAKEELKATSTDEVLSALLKFAKGDMESKGVLLKQANDGLNADGSVRIELAQAMLPAFQDSLNPAIRVRPATPIPKAAPSVYLLRALASPFGAVAPKNISSEEGRFSSSEWPLDTLDEGGAAYLDAVVDSITADSFAILNTPLSISVPPALTRIAPLHSSRLLRFARVRSAQTVARGSYDISSKVTRLDMVDAESGKNVPVVLTQGDFFRVERESDRAEPNLKYLRDTMYVVQSEPVKIAPDDIIDDVRHDRIPLDKFYDGFEAGRWIIVAGERTDIKNASENSLPGIHAAELRTVSGIEHIPYENSPGDTPHTVITLDKPLAYSYKRSSVTIYGNVVVASHGETVPTEVLGSGNAAVALPRFQLKRPPLTYVSASTTSGVLGTETVRVNNVRYHRVDSLIDAKDGERVYELVDDENGIAALTFGSRLPTGQDNVRASYRVGIGAEGNVKAERISLLVSRPLGVQGVINPLKASGGADRDGPERIRRNAPLATLALSPLSRLVSVSDYAAFALRFAGIGHADARKLSDGSATFVHVTVAGQDDIPLTEDGELLTNLRNAYQEFGDPSLPVAISIRELLALVIEAKVSIDPDADWDTVEPLMRSRLLDAFSFERSALGKPVYLSEVFAVMQKVPGVDWVDIDVFGGISESVLLNADELKKAVGEFKILPAFVPCATATTRKLNQARAELWEAVYGDVPRFLPAQLAYLVPQVPGTLALNLSQR